MKTGIKAEIVFLILIVVSLVGLLTMTVNAATTEKVANNNLTNTTNNTVENLQEVIVKKMKTQQQL